jgi:hypothetical protein
MTLRLRNEESLLASAGSDHEAFYRQHLMPFKLDGYRQYLRERTWRRDVAVLRATVFAIALPAHVPALRAQDIVSRTESA